MKEYLTIVTRSIGVLLLSLQISNILALIMSILTLVYLFCVNGVPCCAVDFIYPITLIHRTLVPSMQVLATLCLLFYGKFIVDRVCCIVSQYDVDEQSARVWGIIRLIGSQPSHRLCIM